MVLRVDSGDNSDLIAGSNLVPLHRTCPSKDPRSSATDAVIGGKFSLMPCG